MEVLGYPIFSCNLDYLCEKGNWFVDIHIVQAPNRHPEKEIEEREVLNVICDECDKKRDR